MLCKNLKIYLQGSNTQSRANRDWHQISYEKKFQFHDDAMQNKKKSLFTYMEKKDVFCGKFKNSRKNLFNEVTGHREYTRNSFASVLARKLRMFQIKVEIFTQSLSPCYCFRTVNKKNILSEGNYRTQGVSLCKRLKAQLVLRATFLTLRHELVHKYSILT